MWQAVELRELRTFLVLAEELHFGRTATRLGLTQSRVSQTVRDLERKLGLHLVARTSRRVALTAAGERFRAEAAPALRALEDVLRSGQDAGAQLTEPVRLGIVGAGQISPVLRSLIAAFEAAHPRSGVRFVGLPFTDRFGPLRRGEVELMVTSLPVRQPDLVAGPVLSRHRRLLAVARTSPLAGEPDVSVEQLADVGIGDLDIVAPPELAEEMAPRTTPQGRPIPRTGPPIRDQNELLLAIAGGRVVQPVLESFAVTYQHPDVVYVPIRDLPPSRSVLVWRLEDRDRGLHEFVRVVRSALEADPALSR